MKGNSSCFLLLLLLLLLILLLTSSSSSHSPSPSYFFSFLLLLLLLTSPYFFLLLLLLLLLYMCHVCCRWRSWPSIQFCYTQLPAGGCHYTWSFKQFFLIITQSSGHPCSASHVRVISVFRNSPRYYPFYEQSNSPL